MTGIDLGTKRARINGAFGYYYDNILTQYAIEWELKKALFQNPLDALKKRGTLPLREAAETVGDPILNGIGRCAAITTSPLLVFKRRRPSGFYCLLHKRSANVGVSPNMLHVVPAGMFEAKNFEPWSVEMNVWRELLEEVYNEREQLGTGTPEEEDHIRSKVPIKLLTRLIEEGSAEFVVTGICCDLLNLRTEICTVLVVKDISFIESRKIDFSWEYEKRSWKTTTAGKGAIRWQDVDQVLTEASNTDGVVASAAGCLSLGRDWLKRRHGL